ncbi:hypothetical protein WJX73_001184 [Symbiochloris irregularis]|uniref:BZIP domain-containing protein n=1 Tax=Symbiochloris irregularis TaxID=706552 RepID=A0AAW1PR83_9CHLO
METGRLPSIPEPLQDIFEDFLLTVPALTADPLFEDTQESSTCQTAAPSTELKLNSAVEPESRAIGAVTVMASSSTPKLTGCDSMQPPPNQAEDQYSRQCKRALHANPDSDPDWAPVQEKRPVGRPIEYKGDPDSPLLSEDQKRRVKRRIANRISASRVRQRRQEECAELREQLVASLQREQALMDHIRATECQMSVMQNQIQLLQKNVVSLDEMICCLGILYL